MSLPAAVLVGSLTLELVGREDRKDALFRAEVLPLYSWVGLQIVCQYCREERAEHVTNQGRVAVEYGENTKEQTNGGKPEKGGPKKGEGPSYIFYRHLYAGRQRLKPADCVP